MKAAVYERYGSPDVFKIVQFPSPGPNENEILVRIKATGANTGDARLRRADPFAVRFFFGLFKPKYPILGTVFSGIVEEVGDKVDKFKEGDEVFGSTGMKPGTYAEYLCIAQDAAVAIKPEKWSFEEAASIPFGGETALVFLQKVNILPGQKVLIYGASGAIGTAAVQIAKSRGAEVTAFCSAPNFDLVRSLGADEVFDYRTCDLSSLTGGYDVVMDTVDKMDIGKGVDLLNDSGKLILSGALAGSMIKGAFLTKLKKKKLFMGPVVSDQSTMQELKDMMEKGHLKPVIDKVFTLEQISDAHRIVDSGRKRGNVVVQII